MPEVSAGLKDLADAFSRHAKVANRLWLALMGVSIFTLPQLGKPGSQSTIALPWGLGNVEPAYFYIASAMILSVLATGLCSAHAQMVKVHALVMEAVHRMQTNTSSEQFDVRDVVDSLLDSSFLRVGPLARLIGGRPGLLRHRPPGRALRILSAIYYVALKVMGTIVYVLSPAGALLVTWYAFETDEVAIQVAHPVGAWFITACVTVALFSTTVVLLAELRYVWQRVAELAANPGTRTLPKSGRQ